MATPDKPAFSATDKFVFTPIGGTAASQSSASTTPAPFVFTSAINFDAPPPTTGVMFTVGSTEAKPDEEDEEDDGRRQRSEKGRQNDDDEEGVDDDGDEEDGEDEEEYEDEDDGEEMDEDDEGDTPYPLHEKGPNTVECEQCGEFIPRRELATHEKRVCSETPMECPFTSLHCGATAVNRRLLRAHLNRNMADHMVWIMAQMDEQRHMIQTLSDALEQESSRRRAVEHALEAMGGKIQHSHETPARRGGGRATKSSIAHGASGKRGNVSFSPLPSSNSPPIGGRSGADLPKFSISFDATKPLAMSENRWTPHSIVLNDQKPSAVVFPPKIAGTGNSASDEQTRLKVAAGLLPASALKSPTKPAATTASSGTTVASGPRTPGVDDLPALTKSLKSVLNKLTAANFEKLSAQVVDIFRAVETEATLTALVVLLFDKAVIDSYFSNIYAMLCVELSTHLPPLNGDANKAFKRFLLNQCQAEFEAGVGDIKRKPDESDEAMASRKQSQKQRMIGTIRYIGELYLKDLILHQIMTFCVMHLLPHLEWKIAAPAADDATGGVVDRAALEQEQADSIEAFCKLLTTIGAKFDSVPDGKALLDATVFPKIATAEADKSIPSRLRFMLKDLLDIRPKKWKARAAATQVVATAEKVVTTVEMGLGNGGVPVSSGRGAVHNDARGAPFSPPPRGAQPARHQQQVVFQMSTPESGRRGGGGRGQQQERSGGRGQSNRSGGGGGGGGSDSQWVRGDLLDSQAGSGRKGGGGGGRSGGGGARKR